MLHMDLLESLRSRYTLVGDWQVCIWHSVRKHWHKDQNTCSGRRPGWKGSLGEEYILAYMLEANQWFQANMNKNILYHE